MVLSSASLESLAAVEDISLVRLNDDTVKEHAAAITQELWHNAWHKRLAVIAGVCAVTYGSYYFFLKKSDAPVVPELPTKPDAPVVPDAAAPTSPAQGQREGIQEVTNKDIEKLILEHRIDKSILQDIADFTKEQRVKANSGLTGTLKDWGSTMFSFVVRESAVAVVFSAVVGAFGKYFRLVDNAFDAVSYQIFHPGNLRWYITTHTNIYAAFDDLERYAYCIEHGRLPKKVTNEGEQSEVMLTKEEVAHHIEFFSTTWSVCVKELESILGFMLTKVQQAEVQEDADALQQEAEGQKSLSMLHVERFQQICKQVYTSVDNFRIEAEKLLRKNAPMPTGLVQEVNRLRLLFMEHRSAFISCEKM